MKTAIFTVTALLASLCIHSGREAGAVPSTPLTPDQCGIEVRPRDLPDGDYGGFFTWPELVGEMKGWLQNHPNLISAQRLGTTAEGRAIPLLQISSSIGNQPKPEMLLLVGLHPREQAPTLAVVRFVSELLDGYGHDAQITRLLDSRRLWVVPMLNVDGKIYDFQHGNRTSRGADWRKNRRANADGTFGVDLNRNFPIRWGGNRIFDPSWQASTRTTRGNIYEGPSPASEPETRSVMSFIASRPLRVVLDLHSPLHDMRAPAFSSASEQPIYLDLLQKMRATQKSPYPIHAGTTGEPQSETRGGDSGISYPWSYYTTGAYSFNLEMGFQNGAGGAYSTGLKARYAEPASIEREYADNIRGPLLTLLDWCGHLQLATRGTCQLLGSRWEGAPKPGAKIVWKPQIQGVFDYAALISDSAAGVVPLEFRAAPATSGFVVQIQPETKPGTRIPLSLYVWKGRARSVFHADLIVR